MKYRQLKFLAIIHDLVIEEDLDTQKGNLEADL
jgi:hypothetical protein